MLSALPNLRTVATPVPVLSVSPAPACPAGSRALAGRGWPVAAEGLLRRLPGPTVAQPSHSIQRYLGPPLQKEFRGIPGTPYEIRESRRNSGDGIPGTPYEIRESPRGPRSGAGIGRRAQRPRDCSAVAIRPVGWVPSSRLLPFTECCLILPDSPAGGKWRDGGRAWAVSDLKVRNTGTRSRPT